MIHNINTPIPPISSIDGWQEIVINECGEDFVLLNQLEPEKISVSPAYFLQGIKGSISNCYTRVGVAERLLRASNLLPRGYKLQIWDSWRPLEVQRALFDNYLQQLKMEMKDVPEHLLITEASKFVSLPSAELLKPSPHFTGGSVDLTIIKADGTELDMGTQFDYFGDRAHTDYFELKKKTYQFNALDKMALNNRRLLYFTMIEAGFSNYPFEWWHFDFGNQFWGKLTSNTAIYGGKPPFQGS